MNFLEQSWQSSHIQWVISSSRIVFTNENSGRIRALSWYLIIAYRSRNNKNDHLTRPWEDPRLSAWVSTYHYPRSSNKQLLLWNISSADNQGLPLCWFTYGTEFTYFQIFTSKLSISITIHDATKLRIICLTKTEGFFHQISSFYYEKDTTKDSEGRQLKKPWPTRTILNQNEPKLLLLLL